MFEKLPPSDDDRGQVGIGTLIVFIALVLVAAVAAGVLVNTAGLLQSRAQDTGSDAQAQVSNQIDVVSATGTVSASGSSITEIRLTVKKSSGSDALNLSRATIEYTSDTDAMTLTSGTGFTLSNIKGTTNGQVLDDNGDRVRVTIDLGTTGQPANLGEGSEAMLRLVDESGASTVYGVNVPDAITGDYVLV